MPRFPTPAPQVQKQSRPAPHVVAIIKHYLGQGAELLEGERPCACEHLEGDHLIGGGRCTRCRRCPAFELHPEEQDTEPLALSAEGSR